MPKATSKSRPNPDKRQQARPSKTRNWLAVHAKFRSGAGVRKKDIGYKRSVKHKGRPQE